MAKHERTSTSVPSSDRVPTRAPMTRVDWVSRMSRRTAWSRMERTAYREERRYVSRRSSFSKFFEYQNTMTVEVRGVSQSKRTWGWMLTVSGARLVWRPTVLGAKGLARWMKLSEAAAAILGNSELNLLGDFVDVDVCGEMGEAGPGLLWSLSRSRAKFRRF